MRLSAVLDKVETYQPLTENDAWKLFRFAALSESFGWTILIIGIVINRYKLPGYKLALPIAGQVHGTIFLAYFGILLATYTSLRWSRQKFLVAIIAGVPPYGTLIFEQWASSRRRNNLCRWHFRSIVLSSLTNRPNSEAI
jgi:integral membrane protein